MSRKIVHSKVFVVLFIVCGMMFSAGTSVQAQTADVFTDLATWQSMVLGEELFETTAGNVGASGDDVDLGSPLSYSTSTRDFTIEALESGATFIFNDDIGSGASNDWLNALSVGDVATHEDDDWSLSLAAGQTMSAFGVVLRNNKYEVGETLNLFSGGILKTTINLWEVQDIIDAGCCPTSSNNDFLGVTTDFAFDTVEYDEGSVGDNIAIADFRFATVVPEPGSYVLFITGLSTLGLFTWRRRKQAQ